MPWQQRLIYWKWLLSIIYWSWKFDPIKQSRISSKLRLVYYCCSNAPFWHRQNLLRKKNNQELHKNATSYIEKKSGSNTSWNNSWVATYLSSLNNPNKIYESRGIRIEKQGRNHVTFIYWHVSVGRPAITDLQQLFSGTGCSLEDLPEATDNREEWRERKNQGNSCKQWDLRMMMMMMIPCKELILQQRVGIFFIKGFRTIVFIFIVISTTFLPICPPALLRCLSSKFLRRSLLIFIIKGFRTIVFIFIVISTSFRWLCPPAFLMCLSNSGTYTELWTTSFFQSMVVTCSDSVSHNRVQLLSIPELLFACSQD